MLKKSLYLACFAAMFVSACSDDGSDTKIPVTPDKPDTPVTPAMPELLNFKSARGCAIDSDCNDGLFCFQGVCAMECNASTPCAKGTCDANGRCVNAASAKSISYAKAVVSDVNPTAEIVVSPDKILYVSPRQDSTTVSIYLAKDIGDVLYRIDDGVSGAQIAKTAAPQPREITSGNETLNVVEYVFEIPTNKSALGDKGDIDNLTVISSIGSFNVSLVPLQGMGGYYEGAMKADVFANAEIPLRMAIEVTPANAQSFDKITGINLYLPVSQNDLLTPETAESGKIYWAKVAMEKETANCHSENGCWAGVYGVNDFTIENSKIVRNDLKLNRSIRIEFSAYDAQYGQLRGFARDMIKGLYRERNEKGELQWNNAVIEGDIVMLHATSDEWTPGTSEVRDHKKQTDVTRDINANPGVRCSNDDIKTLFGGFAGDCHISTVQDAENLPAACILNAAKETFNAAKTTADHKKMFVSDLIQTYLTTTDASELTAKAGYASFGEFLAKCGEKKDICIDRTDYVCAADLLSRMYLNDAQNAETEKLSADDQKTVFEYWAKLMRESYIGTQFSAYYNDTSVRKEWLENTDAPRIASKILESFNSNLLAKWNNTVLNAHFDVLGSQFNQTAFEMFTLPVANDGIKSDLDGILNEYADAFQGAGDALQLAIKRYNALYTTTAERAAAAASVRPNLLDLYITGAIEAVVNAATQNTSLNAAYGTALSSMATDIKTLDQSFDNLVYMRDAEVAVSTSVDGTVDNTKLLETRRADAEKVVSAANAKKTEIFNKIEQQEFNQTSIQATLKNNTDALKAQIADICGIPASCKANYIDCDIPVEPLQCGMIQNADDESQANTGEAGAAILAIEEASQDLNIAIAEYNALKNKIDIAESVAENYAERIEKLNTERQEYFNTVQEMLNVIDERESLLSDEQKKVVEDTLKKYQDIYDKQEKQFEAWDKLASDGLESDNSIRDDIRAYNNASMSLEFAGDAAMTTAEAAASYFEDANGVLNAEKAINAAIRGGILTAGALVNVATNAAKLGVDIAANCAETKLEKNQAKREYQIENLERSTDLGIANIELEIEKNQAAFDLFQEGINNLNDNDYVAIDFMREEKDLREQYDRDLLALDEKRAEMKTLLQDLEAKSIAIDKARIVRQRKVVEYYNLVQKAQNLNAQYNAANARLQNITQLYSSPAQVFSSASALEVVESKIDLAKEKIYDYLAAVEYLAVRPFVDLRRAIYLAKSPNDLDGLMDEIQSLVSACGGATTKAEVELSVRQLMGITQDFESMNKAQRFRALLEKGNVPVNALTRYTVDSDVEQLLKKDNLQAGTFEINVNSNLNLAAVCNAKIDTISIQLVGENLTDDGVSVNPTMTVFYNGQTTLTSCQPNIASIVSVLGSKTSYGKQSIFYVQDKKISPRAGINTYAESNQSLNGYPLASSYTVLIDPTLGENAKIHWENVEDISLRIHYTYQDLFDTSSKCAK